MFSNNLFVLFFFKNQIFGKINKTKQTQRHVKVDSRLFKDGNALHPSKCCPMQNISMCSFDLCNYNIYNNLDPSIQWLENIVFSTFLNKYICNRVIAVVCVGKHSSSRCF